MKKQLIVLVLAIALISGAAGGSYAAGRHETQTTNVITTGNIRIALHEDSEQEGGTIVPFSGPVSVMPGSEVSKIVTVENTGSFDAWVRVKLTPQLAGGVGSDIADMISLVENTGTYWEYRDGWYYYLSILPAGETTEPVITGVIFSTGMGNDYSGASVELIACAEATQVKNNGENVWDAAGWPTAD